MVLLSWTGEACAQTKPVYLDESKSIEQRVEDALSRMTLDEKIAIIHAQSKFSSAGVKRLGFPDLWTDDGPHGVRPDVLWGMECAPMCFGTSGNRQDRPMTHVLLSLR